jgi:hypothetical protein
MDATSVEYHAYSFLDMLCKMVLFSKMTDEGNQSIPLPQREMHLNILHSNEKPLNFLKMKSTLRSI